MTEFWMFSGIRIAADFLLAGAVYALGSAYWVERTLTFSALGTLAAFSVGANVLTLTYSQKASDGRRLLLRLVAATGIAIAAYAASRGHLGPAVISRPSFAGLAVAFALAQARSEEPRLNSSHT